MMKEGQETFRFHTLDRNAFWGDALQLHKATAGEKHGERRTPEIAVTEATLMTLGRLFRAGVLFPLLGTAVGAGHGGMGGMY
jgi:hypothetical protein